MPRIAGHSGLGTRVGAPAADARKMPMVSDRIPTGVSEARSAARSRNDATTLG